MLLKTLLVGLFGTLASFAEPMQKHNQEDQDFMKAAIEEAQIGMDEGGIPIGSVLVYEGKIIGRGHNQRMQKNSAIHHGEMNCLENAGRLSAEIYQKATLYTTLSPCPMCSGAIRLYKIAKVVIGENETFMGDEKLLIDSGVCLTVLNDFTCKEMMKTFIADHPDEWNEDIGVTNPH